MFLSSMNLGGWKPEGWDSAWEGRAHAVGDSVWEAATQGGTIATMSGGGSPACLHS